MKTPEPKRPTRFDLDAWRKAYWEGHADTSGSYVLALASEEAAIEFALLVTEFTHLEFTMERLAAHLLGTDSETGSHVMRSIVSAQARIKLMKNVLERARHNQKKSSEFDQIIREFSRLNDLRNHYVHARYLTSEETGDVTWSRPNSDPMLLDVAAYEPFDVEKLRTTRKAIGALSVNITRAIGRDVSAIAGESL